MNPLITEYNKRLASANLPTTSGSNELLQASIHEAGHWMAFAHYKVPVVDAVVYRDFRVGGGIVIPTATLGCVPEEMEAEADYVSTLAGTYAMDALTPFMDRKINITTSMEDVRFARELLDNIHGENIGARKLFMEKYAIQTRQLIHQNWPIIEALAYELMKHGGFFCGECGKVERRYGIGCHAFTAARLKSAQQKLAAFHPSPDDLVRALLAIS